MVNNLPNQRGLRFMLQIKNPSTFDRNLHKSTTKATLLVLRDPKGQRNEAPENFSEVDNESRKFDGPSEKARRDDSSKRGLGSVCDILFG